MSSSKTHRFEFSSIEQQLDLRQRKSQSTKTLRLDIKEHQHKPISQQVEIGQEQHSVDPIHQRDTAAPQRAQDKPSSNLSNLSLRFARRDSRSSSDTLSVQSASKRSYIDLTGDDDNDIAKKPTNSQVDTASRKSHHKIVVPSVKKRIDVGFNKPIQSFSRVVDQPLQKRVKVNDKHAESDSDDELYTGGADQPSTKMEAKSNLLLRKFQLPTGKEKTPSNVIIAIPSLEQRQFLKKLERLRGPPVSLINEFDDSSPPLSFTFVNESVIGKNVERIDEEFMSGCECREENGRNCGCEYRSCHCLQQSDKDDNGNVHFPYFASRENWGCLRPVYLNSRNHIYECNKKCSCRANCKNRNVQHGRQVPLEIFKTTNRGWGIRCPKHLKKGQFIDTYRGEIITDEEAHERSLTRNDDLGNYQMNLDKFNPKQMISRKQLKEELPSTEYDKIKAKVKNGTWEVTTDKNGVSLWQNPDYQAPFVCDGMEVGGPTRFINHSCEPNCRLFTVSYHHADERIYDLAFFTIEEILPGTELTFDYKDEDDRDVITDEMADEVEREKGYRPARCLCGSKNCRQYFFN